MQEEIHPYYDRPKTAEKIAVAVTGTMLGLAIIVNGAYTVMKDLNKPMKKVENVISGPEPEEFYEINGKRAYLAIDGKRIDEPYLTQRK